MEPWLKHAGVYSLEQLFGDYYGVLRLSEKEREEMKTLLLAIKEELKNRRERYEVMVRLLVCRILLMVYETGRKVY